MIYENLIVGVDIDEVVARYVKGLRGHLALTQGLTAEEAMELYPEIDTYEFNNWGPEFVKNFRQIHGDAVDNGLYAELEAYPHASEVLWKLSDEGYHLRIITSRFVNKLQHFRVMADTGLFLDRQNIPFRDVAFTSHKTEIYADVYLDDAPKNISAFQEKGSNVIIFDKEYNRQFEGDRVTNWLELDTLIHEKYPLAK